MVCHLMVHNNVFNIMEYHETGDDCAGTLWANRGLARIEQTKRKGRRCLPAAFLNRNVQ